MNDFIVSILFHDRLHYQVLHDQPKDWRKASYAATVIEAEPLLNGEAAGFPIVAFSHYARRRFPMPLSLIMDHWRLDREFGALLQTEPAPHD